MVLLRLGTVVTAYIVCTQIIGHVEMLNCGDPGPNIVSNTTLTHYWPWAAAILHKSNGKIPLSYQCGGTLISSNWIITAAQCLYRGNAPVESVSLKVELFGSNGDGTKSFEVTEVIIHPNYDLIDHSNDIALMRLSGDADQQPICLWPSSKRSLSKLVGKDGMVIGWSRTECGERSNELRQMSLSVGSSLACLRSNRNFYGSYLAETNFCAGHRNGTSICTAGDIIGGSMSFLRDGWYHIRGIVSVVPSKQYSTVQGMTCDSLRYALFTDVAQYLEWIGDKTTVGCQTKIRCREDWYYYGKCRIYLPVENSSPQCDIIFDHHPNEEITELHIFGESETFPDIGGALVLFEELKTFDFTYIKLKSLNFTRIPSLHIRRIEVLDFEYNHITQLLVDTFDHFENLKHLGLGHNKLKELPEDVFRGACNLELIKLEFNQLETLPAGVFRYNRNLRDVFLGENQLSELHADLFEHLKILETLQLNGNRLESLPQGLFRNNRKLKEIHLQKNKIKRIETDFSYLSALVHLDFGENVCIDEYCDGRTFCGTSSPVEMNQKIRANCTTN